MRFKNTRLSIDFEVDKLDGAGDECDVVECYVVEGLNDEKAVADLFFGKIGFEFFCNEGEEDVKREIKCVDGKGFYRGCFLFKNVIGGFDFKVVIL